jgi:hypothetical protein
MGFFRKAEEPAAVKAGDPIVRFSSSVPGGYLDCDGKWYATEREAAVASATKHIEKRLMYTGDVYLRLAMSEYKSVSDILKEPNVIRAMAILGGEKL